MLPSINGCGIFRTDLDIKGRSRLSRQGSGFRPAPRRADPVSIEYRGNGEETAMSLLRKMGFAALLVALGPWSASQASVYLGVGVGGPGYYRPYGCYHRHGWGYGGYYRPYGFGMVVAPPVVVGAAPIVVQQPAIVQQPVVVQPAYSPASPPPQAPRLCPCPRRPLPRFRPFPRSCPRWRSAAPRLRSTRFCNSCVRAMNRLAPTPR